MTAAPTTAAPTTASPTPYPTTSTPTTSHGYFKGTLGDACPQGHNIDEKACRAAATAFGMYYQGPGNRGTNSPTACYVGYKDLDPTLEGYVYFNTHFGGTASNINTPVCQAACPSFTMSKQLLFYEFYKEQCLMNK